MAELKVAAELVERGYRIALPYGEDHDYDLILCRDDQLERVQVKYTESDGSFVAVKCLSYSLTNGRIRRTKHYTARTIEWLAVYDSTTDRCFYLPASELRDGRSRLHLRLTPARNNQRVGIRRADDYSEPEPRVLTVEPAGFEPAASCLQSRRSAN